ncbi:lipoma HMGIC fusion partner-like isoform X2 [Varroa destructor]|uniref:Uncharacterized protein n=1 Tax=Varroa destructor TaxID=109461 RepID=A0A7M7K7C9_VARDE|nr:lipoma HMGIC fusion partner-like isoform X2 [Varroa destructor]
MKGCRLRAADTLFQLSVPSKEVFCARPSSASTYTKCQLRKCPSAIPLSYFARLEIVLECGRYASFSSIPSAAWRAASVLIGIAASLALLVAFIALIGCFTADAVNSFLAKTLGFIQLVAGLFVAAGLGLYPLGYGNPQVKEACGDISEPFHLGPKCKYSWSLYMLSVATLSLWLCSALSLKASRMTPHFYRI